MNLWTFLTVIIVAGIVSEVLKSYFKHKSSGEEVKKLVKDQVKRHDAELETLRKRVRNLEVIAASDPGEFQGLTADDVSDFDTEDSDELNERLVNQLARKKKTR